MAWGLGRAAVCNYGTPWTFLLPFFTADNVLWPTRKCQKTNIPPRELINGCYKDKREYFVIVSHMASREGLKIVSHMTSEDKSIIVSHRIVILIDKEYS